MTPAIFLEILKALASLFPLALKLFQVWQEHHQQKLTAEVRARIVADIKTAVKQMVETKNTSGLENIVKSLGKPQATDVPNPQNPS